MSNFGDLINIDEYGDKREQFNKDRGGIAYYCKDCKKIINVKENGGKKYNFICNECGGIEIVIGTLEGLKSNYKLSTSL